MDFTNVLGLLVGGSIFLILAAIGIIMTFIVFYVYGLWKLFKKAGKKGWEAIIPYYNTWILVEISGLNWWYFLIAITGSIASILGIEGLSGLASLASCFANFFIFYNLAKKMHKEPIPTAIIGAILSGIMAIIMGLSKDYQYDSTIIVDPNGPFGDKK